MKLRSSATGQVAKAGGRIYRAARAIADGNLSLSLQFSWDDRKVPIANMRVIMFLA